MDKDERVDGTRAPSAASASNSQRVITEHEGETVQGAQVALEQDGYVHVARAGTGADGSGGGAGRADAAGPDDSGGFLTGATGSDPLHTTDAIDEDGMPPVATGKAAAGGARPEGETDTEFLARDNEFVGARY